MVKCVLMFFMLFLTLSCIGQLNGPVPQKNIPPNSKVVKKAASNKPADIAKNNAIKIKESLKLTEAQYNDLYKTLLDYEVKVDLTQKGKSTNAEKYKKVNALNKVRQEQMKKILTKDQYHQYIMSFP